MTLKPLPTAIAVLVLTTGMALAEKVEIYAIDRLDNIQNGYCIDISGGQGAQANPDNGLQGHTCYSPKGEIFVDQAFDADRFAGGVFYMPEFDVCMEAVSAEAGAALELATCDGSDAQSFSFGSDSTISPAVAPDLCLTLGDETRFGRSQTNQIKALTLAECSAEAAPFQSWAYRTAN